VLRMQCNVKRKGSGNHTYRSRKKDEIGGESNRRDATISDHFRALSGVDPRSFLGGHSVKEMSICAGVDLAAFVDCAASSWNTGSRMHGVWSCARPWFDP
jgi:hypothetical protein